MGSQQTRVVALVQQDRDNPVRENLPFMGDTVANCGTFSTGNHNQIQNQTAGT